MAYIMWFPLPRAIVAVPFIRCLQMEIKHSWMIKSNVIIAAHIMMIDTLT